jgi:hypothetical protein
MKKVFRFLISEKFQKSTQVFANIIVILGVCFSLIQINKFEFEKQDTTLNDLLKLEDRIYDGNHGKSRTISRRITHGEKIVDNNMIDQDDLDEYISSLSNIYITYKEGLITKDEVNDWFSDTLLDASNNKEVQDYLSIIRKNDNQAYLYFDKGVQLMNK